MINFNLDKSLLKYIGFSILAPSLLLLAYILGVKEGTSAMYKQHELEKSQLLTQIDQNNQDLISRQIELTACRAEQKGECVLDCEELIQERVSKALATCAASCRD